MRVLGNEGWDLFAPILRLHEQDVGRGYGKETLDLALRVQVKMSKCVCVSMLLVCIYTTTHTHTH